MKIGKINFDIKIWRIKRKMKCGGGIAYQRWPCMATQDWNGFDDLILPRINMTGDISHCGFLSLECVINVLHWKWSKWSLEGFSNHTPTCFSHMSHQYFSHKIPLFNIFSMFYTILVRISPISPLTRLRVSALGLLEKNSICWCKTLEDSSFNVYVGA